jgi:hypothetical protein
MIIATGTIGQHRHHVQIPWNRAEHWPITTSQVHHDLRPFGGREQQPAHPPGRRQKPGIGRNYRELPIVGKC